MTFSRPSRTSRLLGSLVVAGLVLTAVAVPAQAAAAKTPPAPTSVKAKATSTTVTITWKSGKRSTKGFNVYRSTTSKVSLTKPLNGKKTLGKSTTSFKTSGLASSKAYWFVVQSVGSKKKKAQAKAIKVTTLPKAPSAAALTATAGDTKVTLTWKAGTKGGVATGWSVYRSLSTTKIVAPANLITKKSLSGSARSYTDTARVNGTTYRYVVVAANTGGGAASNTASSTPLLGLPGAPIVTAVPNNGSVTVSWAPGAGGASASWKVYRASSTSGVVAPANLLPNGSVPGTTLSLTDGGWNNATPRYYVVVATNTVGSTQSEIKRVGSQFPAVPTLSAAPGDKKVDLAWIAGTGSGATATWDVYRSTNPSVNTATATKIVTAAPVGTTTFTDTGRTNGITYYYVVKATNAFGSAESTEASAKPKPPTPGAPTLGAAPGDATVGLTWAKSAPTDTVDTWDVYRSTASPLNTTTATKIVTAAPPSTLTFQDTGRTNGTPYYYVVVAHNASGDKTSNEASATPVVSAPGTPTLTATGGDAKVTLAWTPGAGGPVATWDVYRSTTTPVDPATATKIVPAAASTTTTFVDSGRTNGVTYRYLVIARNAGGAGTSEEKAATPALPAPAKPNLATSAGDGAVDLTWSKGSAGDTVESWKVYGSSSAFGVVAPANLLATESPATLTYSDSPLTNGATRYYVVVATNSTGSTASSQRSATPSTASSAQLVVSNPAGVAGSDRFVMSRMTYCLSTGASGDIATCVTPDLSSLIRAKNPDNANAVTWFAVHDVATVQVANTGTEDAVVTDAFIDDSSSPDSFSVDAAPATIPAGQSRDVKVRFDYTGGSTYGAVVRSGSLRLTVAGLSDVVVPLTGVWQPGPNRSTDGTLVNYEPSVAQIVNGAYGMSTAIGSAGVLDNNRGDQGFGDETLSRFWTLADDSAPATVHRLASFSSSGLGKISWYDTDTIAKSLSGCTTQPGQVCHDVAAASTASGATSSAPVLGQSVLPNGSTTFSFTPDSTRFALYIGGESSDNQRNSTVNDVSLHGCTSPCGHHMRFFPVKDGNGVLVPNAYVVTVDLTGQNNDFNDDMVLVTNIKPTSGPVS